MAKKRRQKKKRGDKKRLKLTPKFSPDLLDLDDETVAAARDWLIDRIAERAIEILKDRRDGEEEREN